MPPRLGGPSIWSPWKRARSTQAWLWESPDEPYILATFDVDENGQALVPMWVPAATKGNRWMLISVEHAGGALTPVGERVLRGVFDDAAP